MRIGRPRMSSGSNAGKPDKIVALAGNPNVGKSTIFNELTGLRQHTGNWAGKTVANAWGHCKFGDSGYALVDLPGCYSLAAHSEEERIAGDFIRNENPDAVVVVCDAACLERNLNLALQIIEIIPNVIICVNLIDEAEKKHISVDLSVLSDRLGVPVIATAARGRRGLDALMQCIAGVLSENEDNTPPSERIGHKSPRGRTEDDVIASIFAEAESICRDSVTFGDKKPDSNDRKIDNFLTSKWFGFPIMFLGLLIIFWLTISGANYPSQLLSNALFWIEDRLLAFFIGINTPKFVCEMLVLGVYRVLAWVVSVMLPPMAIFFPLFTLLEDAGYLPRVAFNLDRCYKKCRACGKQALTMCMGFGCNAAGVIGCRIIDSPRERLIAIITNNFVPCNGRFPTLITLIAIFFAGVSGVFSGVLSALLLTCLIVLGIAMTFIISKLLSSTILRGVPSSFTLELPPYRKPQFFKVIVRSVFDRTLFVLGRAVAIAIPAGLVIWLMANITVHDITLLSHCSTFLDPFARILGMDGVILLAFILGFPANEIVIPIIIMAYMARGNIIELNSLSVLKDLLLENGWTWITAVSVMLFSLMHWPCSTTCLTIKKETGSLKWTVVSIVVPTVTGMLICFVFASIAGLFMR